MTTRIYSIRPNGTPLKTTKYTIAEKNTKLDDSIQRVSGASFEVAASGEATVNLGSKQLGTSTCFPGHR